MTSPGMSPVQDPGGQRQQAGPPFAGRPQPYPPPGYAGPPRYPAPPVPRGPRPPALVWVSALLLALGGILAIVGSFVTLDSFVTVSRPEGTTTGTTTTDTTTTWGFHYSGPSTSGPTSQWLGIPVVLGAVLAIGAALLLMITLRRTAATARSVAAAAAAVLFGTALTVVCTVFTDLGFARTERDFATTIDPGIGFWLLLGATVLGAAAVVCLLLAGRGGATGRIEPETPRQGFPMPVAPAPYGPPGYPAPPQQAAPPQQIPQPHQVQQPPPGPPAQQ